MSKKEDELYLLYQITIDYIKYSKNLKFPKRINLKMIQERELSYIMSYTARNKHNRVYAGFICKPIESNNKSVPLLNKRGK